MQHGTFDHVAASLEHVLQNEPHHGTCCTSPEHALQHWNRMRLHGTEITILELDADSLEHVLLQWRMLLTPLNIW